MKRVYLFLFLLLLIPFNVKADNEGCTSQEKIKLNTLASYLTIGFEFNEKSATFNVVIENMSPYLIIDDNENEYRYSSKGTKIKKINEGTKLRLLIKASEYSECYDDTIRTITYVTPYINRFLETSECFSNPEVEICNTKFTNYKLDEKTFKRMFEKQKKKQEQEEVVVIEEEDPWYKEYLEYIRKYGMQVGLFLIGTTAMLILGQNAVKRAKAKF